MTSLALGLSITAILLSMITLVIGILSLAYVVGLKKSTHQIQYVPVNDGLDDKQIKEDFEETMSTAFDDDEAIHI